MIQQIIMQFTLIFGPCHVNAVIVPELEMPVFRDAETGQIRHAWGYASNPIKLNDRFWRNATDVQKRELMYHELGHECLGLLHPFNAWDYSIMNSIKNVTRPDGKNWDELVSKMYWKWKKKGRKK